MEEASSPCCCSKFCCGTDVVCHDANPLSEKIEKDGEGRRNGRTRKKRNKN